jgi:hypothetical protein
MDVLKERLRVFSADRERWNRYVHFAFTYDTYCETLTLSFHSMLPRTVQMHLGPTAGRITKNKKQSVRRWDLMQAEHELASGSAIASGSRSLLPRPTASEKHQATLNWVSNLSFFL